MTTKKPRSRSGLLLPVGLLAPLVVLPTTALANHGPGTSGGGSSVASGETLKLGAWDLSFRVDHTEFEDVDRDEAERRTMTADNDEGEFDAIRRSTLATLSLAYGVTEDFQLGASWGWYQGQDFIDAEFDSGAGTTESAKADPAGMTDLWINAKYRVLRGEPGNLALLAGVKLPTGKDDEQLDDGEELEPSSQPGSGSVDWQGGVAWSRFLTSNVTIDASALYTLRTPHERFAVGDRMDAGVAVAWRLTDSIQQFPQVSVFAEANVVWLGKDEDDGAKNGNSGGTTLYLTPGARVRFSPAVSLTIAPSFPVVQDLNGEQVETRYKVAATLDFSF